jgi:hypothetical protein
MPRPIMGLAALAFTSAAIATSTARAATLRICHNRRAHLYHPTVWAIGRTSRPFASAITDRAFGYGSGEAFRPTSVSRAGSRCSAG